MGRHKRYRKTTDPLTRRSLPLHRHLAAQVLGRPLLPGEVVHHRDGDSLNNAPDNLLVLPSQRYHAHIEFHLRREKTGMPSLFPELFQSVKLPPCGGLFDCLLPLQVQEPPLSVRKVSRGPSPIPIPDCDPLFPAEEPSAHSQPCLIIPDAASVAVPGPRHLGDLLAYFQVQTMDQQLIPLSAFPAPE